MLAAALGEGSPWTLDALRRLTRRQLRCIVFHPRDKDGRVRVAGARRLTEEDRFRRRLRRQGQRPEDIDRAWRDYLEEEGVRWHAERLARQQGQPPEAVEAAAERAVREFRQRRDGL